MLRVLSTHLFLNERLHPGLLESGRQIRGTGSGNLRRAPALRLHQPRARGRAGGRGSAPSPLQPFSMHAPLFPDREMGRAGAPAVNVLHPEKSRRIDAMDEIKRALEAAEQIPFKNLVMHLGEGRRDGRHGRMEYAEYRPGTSGRLCPSAGRAPAGGEPAQRARPRPRSW